MCNFVIYKIIYNHVKLTFLALSTSQDQTLENLNSCIGSINSLRPHGAHQTPLSMELSRQEYWSEELFPSPGELPNTWMEPD